MKKLLALLLAIPLLLAQGPSKGTLVIAGGGKLGPDVAKRFMELAGGPDASVVLIPTADPTIKETFLKDAGFRNVTVLHTLSRAEANSKDFVRPLRKARAVWISGGRQWRLVDSYLDTRTLKELNGVLKRGGVIGGSSAGASIQASYMVRGAKEGNTIMMAPGYEHGFGFMRKAAVDQHLLTRKREKDMLPVVEKHPELLGIGIDEKTAIVVKRDEFEVIGPSKVAIYQNGHPDYYFLVAGDRFDLRNRSKK